MVTNRIPGSSSLTGHERFRYVINCFTRMRYCDINGALDFNNKKAPGSTSADLFPWYAHPARKTQQHHIAFGHWSTVTLGTHTNFDQWNVYPLDTGCLWGGELSAFKAGKIKPGSVCHQGKLRECNSEQSY